jgi:hypothetical protein
MNDISSFDFLDEHISPQLPGGAQTSRSQPFPKGSFDGFRSSEARLTGRTRDYDKALPRVEIEI